MLQQIRRDLSRATPLTLVLGGAIGAGLTRLLLEPLRQGTAFALETSMVEATDLFAPLVVNLIWISCCVPDQVALSGQILPGAGGQRSWGHGFGVGVAAAMATTLLLLPYFVVSVLLASLLASPRPDLGAELPLMLGALTPSAVGLAVGRTLLLAATSASLCQLIGRQGRRRPGALPALISTSIVNCALAVILLEVFLRAIVPAIFSSSP